MRSHFDFGAVRRSHCWTAHACIDFVAQYNFVAEYNFVAQYNFVAEYNFMAQYHFHGARSSVNSKLCSGGIKPHPSISEGINIVMIKLLFFIFSGEFTDSEGEPPEDAWN